MAAQAFSLPCRLRCQGGPGRAGARLAGRTGSGARRVDLDALAVAPVCRARAELLAPLGVQPSDVVLDGHVLGTQVDTDPTGATTVPGVWAAGNVTSIQAQVASSAAAGLAAAAAVNNDLITEDASRVNETRPRTVTSGAGAAHAHDVILRARRLA